ncbi:hypothetical protein K438DRAFT_1844589 [Mycena galopus ATCC 62051]|nr:hypothetical protein K438DRAFT_1844589 [Mycena galopus ATCC 62051]
MNYAVSTLRSRVINMKYTPWKVYPNYLRAIASSIKECRREIEELRSTILLALECARQQRYSEDIQHRMATLASAFPEDMAQIDPILMKKRTGSNQRFEERRY